VTSNLWKVPCLYRDTLMLLLFRQSYDTVLRQKVRMSAGEPERLRFALAPVSEELAANPSKADSANR
jgi:hypothetical protein